MPSSQVLHEALIGAPANSQQYAETIRDAIIRFQGGQGRFDLCVVGEAMSRQRDGVARLRAQVYAQAMDRRILDMALRKARAAECWVGLALIIGVIALSFSITAICCALSTV